MPEATLWLCTILFAVGGVAGFVDAIAGGGGLLTLPSLLLAGLSPHLALGTNKGQGVFGTTTSLLRFSFSTLLDRSRAIVSFPAGLIGSACGGWLVRRIAPDRLTPLVMVMLAAAAVFMLLYRPAGASEARPRHPRGATLAVVVAFALAFYDGFFGPGTGTFLIVMYVWLWRDPPDAASANAKVVNMASNLGSFMYFAWSGLVVWKLALPMAAGQVIGGFAGAHLTIRKGKTLVRYAVIVVSLALIARLVWRWL